jgi:hypothetical protein
MEWFLSMRCRDFCRYLQNQIPAMPTCVRRDPSMPRATVLVTGERIPASYTADARVIRVRALTSAFTFTKRRLCSLQAWYEHYPSAPLSHFVASPRSSIAVKYAIKWDIQVRSKPKPFLIHAYAAPIGGTRWITVLSGTSQTAASAL